MTNIAFVLDDAFEDSEFRKPNDGLRAKGHTAITEEIVKRLR